MRPLGHTQRAFVAFLISHHKGSLTGEKNGSLVFVPIPLSYYYYRRPLLMGAPGCVEHGSQEEEEEESCESSLCLLGNTTRSSHFFNEASHLYATFITATHEINWRKHAMHGDEILVPAMVQCHSSARHSLLVVVVKETIFFILFLVSCLLFILFIYCYYYYNTRQHNNKAKQSKES